MTKFRAALALAAVLILSACYPPSTSHPVGTTAGLKNDPALTGTWRTLPQPHDGGGAYFHILPRGEKNFTVIIAPAHGTADGVIVATASSARLRGYGFLNAELADSEGRPLHEASHGTVPFLYRFDTKGTLSLYTIDGKAALAAIRTHKVAGKVDKHISGDDIVFTDDPKALDRFFQSPAGLALFVKPWAVLKKVE